MKLRQGLLAQSLLSAPLVAGFLLCAAPVMAQPVQGLYIAGEGGATFNQDQQVRRSANLPTGRDKWHAGGIGLGSIGYGLGNGFRVEVEGDYRSMAYKRFIADNVSGRADGRRQTAGVMANAFFDMDVGQPWIFPYFGAGVGYGWTKLNTSFTAPNGQLSQQTRGTFGNFAYQGIFGLAFPTPWVVGLSFTAEYRFWTMLGPQSHSTLAYGTVGGYSNQPKSAGWASGNRDTKTDFNHSLMLGLRYEFNPAPPPPPPPSETPAPAPQAARSYLVFFDWDKADLTDRARSIVSTAALASTHTTLTRITVSGYTDNSSAHPGQKSGLDYNKKLSFRRAEIVKAELVRDGVPGATIDIHGYGESNPLVHTGPNTKEAQNRRVEIIFR